MANWDTEHYVKITPRRKNDWGFASMGNDYNNFESAEEYNAYYEKQCKQIADNIEEHYRDFDIKFIESCTNEYEQKLEEEVDALKDKLEDLKDAILNTILKANNYKSVGDVLTELNRILRNEQKDNK